MLLITLNTYCNNILLKMRFQDTVANLKITLIVLTQIPQKAHILCIHLYKCVLAAKTLKSTVYSA